MRCGFAGYCAAQRRVGPAGIKKIWRREKVRAAGNPLSAGRPLSVLPFSPKVEDNPTVGHARAESKRTAKKSGDYAAGWKKLRRWPKCLWGQQKRQTKHP